MRSVRFAKWAVQRSQASHPLSRKRSASAHRDSRPAAAFRQRGGPQPAEKQDYYAPETWHEREDLHVDGVPVDWWVEGDGPDAVVHATHVAALARGLAQAAGRWGLRHALEIALTDPDRAAELATEALLDPP